MRSLQTDERSAQLLALLGEPRRAQIVQLLAREQLCTCHLVEELGTGQPAVSNHLRLLREAGVVEAEPCGRYTYYRLRPEVLDDLAGALAELADTARTAPKRACP